MIQFLKSKERVRFTVATLALLVSLFTPSFMIGELVRILLLSGVLLFGWNAFGEVLTTLWKGDDYVRTPTESPTVGFASPTREPELEREDRGSGTTG